MLERLGQRIESLPAVQLMAAVVFVAGVVSAIDVFTGPDIGFSFFYLIPLSAVAWRFGRANAIASSILAALVWLFIDYTTGPARPWIVPAWNALIRVAFFTAITVLLVGLRMQLDRQTELSRTDPLTGLLNRRAFTELADREFARARRTHDPLTVAMFDLDDFKSINDTFGHEVGDDALRLVAAVIADASRTTDVTGRLGGDEFAAVFAADEGAATVVLERLRHRVASTQVSGRPLSCSIGAWTCNDGTLAEALANADRNLYQAKQAGEGTMTITSSPAASAGALEV